MSRDDRDQRGGHNRTSRFHVSEGGYSDFTRQGRKRVRAKAKRDLRRNGDPKPDYPVAHEYWD